MAAHPLTRPACWALTTGAPDMPLIRWAGGLLWAGGALIGMVWLMALTDDALAGYLHPAYLLLAWPVMLAWLFVAWHIWRRWAAGPRALLLEWHGPVSLAQEPGQAHGGFHVGQWRAPVRVRVALSMQGWLLLSLTPVRGGRHLERAAYAWLDARERDAAQASSRDRSVHQLRTLLHLPPSMTTLEHARAGASSRLPGREAQNAGKQVASWSHSLKPGSMLRRLIRSFRADRQPGLGTSSLLDTAFPATTVMADRRGVKQVTRVRDGGHG